MKIVVIGTGYVGLVSGTCLAEKGWHVTCVDKIEDKIHKLQQGIIPIYEPGLEELVSHNYEAGRLIFTTNMKEAIAGADIIMIAVGTPTRTDNGNADLSYVYQSAEEIAGYLTNYTVIVTKSTVPAGTSEYIKEIISGVNPNAMFDVASNPEFLREGNAIQDFMEPDRIVIGTDSERAKNILLSLYKPFSDDGYRIITTDLISSELTKYAANTFLATKVSFINEIADLCEKLGGNIQDIVEGIGSDSRIGMKFLQPGPGYGGSCFPKDTLAMVNIGERALSPATIVEAVINVNRARPYRMVSKIQQALGGSVRGKHIALLGLTFKPNTDDVRHSTSLFIAEELVAGGAKVTAYDPQGMRNAKEILGNIVTFAASAEAALQGADIAVIATEWNEFRELPLLRYKELLKKPAIVDLRNIFSLTQMQHEGFVYYSIGRQPVEPHKV